MSGKSARSGKTSKASQEPRLTSNVVAAFLNSYYTNFVTPENQNGAKFVFRAVTESNEDKIKGKPVIDINDCDDLAEFNKLCKDAQRKHPNAKLSKDEMNKIILKVYNGRLRGLLHAAANPVIKPDEENEEKPKKEKKEKKSKKDKDAAPEEPTPRAKPAPKDNTFEKGIIPALCLGKPKEQSIEGHVDAINDFFNNGEKLRTRVYNLCFPHSLHDTGKDAKGVNIIYLQRISKFHDDVLRQLVEGVEDREILSFVQSKYIESFKFPLDSKLNEEEREGVKLQLRNAEIVTNILTPPAESKWIDQLKAIKLGPKGKGQVQTTNPLSKAEKEAVRQLVRELRIVLAFNTLVRKAVEANPEGPSLRECYENYSMILTEIAEFHAAHKPKVRNHFTFIKFLVESAIFIKSKFGYKENVDPKKPPTNHLKLFITELHSKIPFKFNKDIRKSLVAFVNGTEQFDDEKLAEVAEDYKDEWTDLNGPKSYDVSKLDIYAKIGKIVPATLGKQYRVAVGLHIFQFILEQIRIQRALTIKRKADIAVYIRV